MADPVIKCDDTVRTPADMKPADLEGLEGKWLDVPRLQQLSSETRSSYWCGRTSASMIYNYYCKANKKTDQYVEHDDADKVKGTNGAAYNLHFAGGPNKGKPAGLTDGGLCAPANVFVAAGWQLDTGELAKDQNADPDQAETYFARHIEQLKKNNPLVQFTQLTKHKGHIVVICGYKKDSNKGELWLRICDPCYPHEDLLGKGNYEIITRPSKPGKEFSEYWLKARRLLEPYPGRSTRLYAHGDSPLGHFFFAKPDTPVKDDSELVHKVGKGLGATSTAPKDEPPASGKKKKDDAPPPADSSGDKKADTGKAPPAACPPVTGVPRLPYALNKSTLVTGEALTALYHQTERGPGGFFPLGESGLFHCGAHVTPGSGAEIMAMADGEVVAARIGQGPGEHPWGDTGFVLLRHKLKGDKNIYCLYLHLKKEPLHPDNTDALWLKRLLIDAMEDPKNPKKPKWRVMEPQPTWKDADKGKFSPTNVDTKNKLAPGVYEEEAELVQDSKRYVKLKEKWIRAIGPDGDGGKVKELSPFSDYDLPTACKNSPAVKALNDGKVAVLDSIKGDDGKSHKYLVEGGETVGKSGKYLGSESLHWSVFSKDAVFPGGSLPDAEFAAADAVKVADLDLSSKDPGTKEHATALIEAVDPKKAFIGKEDLPWIVAPGELREFYRAPTECWRARYQAVKSTADFKLDVDKLVGQDRYKSHTDAEKGDFKKNAKDFLFWDELSSAEDFPADGKAVFVHPVTALRLMSEVRVEQDHDDPQVEPGANAEDRLHAEEDVVLVVRDAKGPVAAADVTVKAGGAEVFKGKTDSQGEVIVKLEDVQGKDIEISLDAKVVGDKGQLVQVANETSAPETLTPGDQPGVKTFNGDEVVPDARLGLPVKIKQGQMVRQFARWNADKFEPEGPGALFDPEASVEIERFVFRKDDGTYECAQTFVGGVETYFWSIDDGKENVALDLPAEKQSKDPQVFASWSTRMAHLTDHPVLAGRVQNIDDGAELEITWCAILAKGAPEHDAELHEDKVKVAAGGFAAAFDPHVLTSENDLLNAPRPVYAKVKAKGKDLPLRDQAVTVYGDAKFPDTPKPVDKGPGAGPAAAGKPLEVYFEVARDDATDHFTGWSKEEYPKRKLSQLTGAITSRLSGDGQDEIWIAACQPSQHLALESEGGKALADALADHGSLLRKSFPDAPDWIIASDEDKGWAAGNGMQTGICAHDCQVAVTSAGRKSGCTEAIRVKNLTSCQHGSDPACAKVVQIGARPSVKKDACPDEETSCAAAGHDKSKCFLDGVVKGDKAEERERWHVRLPMRTSGAGYPYLRDDHQNLRVVLINPATGAAVVCSQEARGPYAKSQGNVEVPEAAVAKDELKDKDAVLAASYETFWKLGLPRGAGDAVVMIAFVDNTTPLGPLVDGTPIKLKKNRAHPVAMGDSPPLQPGMPGDKVKSSNITVGGKHFVDWYNGDLRGAYPGKNTEFPVFNQQQPNFPGPLNKAQFCKIFDNCEHLWAPEMSLQEFIGMFLIFANETGGTLTPLGERGGKKYWFEKGLKASYNQGMGTIPAGTRLRELGQVLSDDDFTAWNGTGPYPDDSSIDPDKLEQCDFIKYRGHGLIQLTYRGNYQQHCEPSLKKYYGKGLDDFSTKELEDLIYNDPKVYLEMVRSFFKMLGDKFSKVNDNDFYPTGRGVSGGQAYGKLYEWRCNTLMQEMTKATFEFR